MSLFHSTPVTVQRTYYKPSAMSRLKALFTSRTRTHRPVATTTTRRRRRAAPVRQPVRKSAGLGLFRRSPRRTVVATQRRPGFFASLRPRRHVYGHARRRPVATGAPRQHHGGKGRTFATVLAALSLKKHRRRGHGAHYGYGGYGARPRY